MLFQLFYFLLMMFVISLVCSAVRRDDFGEIVRVATRLFLYLATGTLLFCGAFHFAMEWL